MAQAQAQHILISTEEVANSLKKDIASGGNFSELAKEHSQCRSGARGGDLGTFGPGQMVPAFDKVVWSAPIGEIQGPIKTDFGYHLILVNKRS
jgi:peptidyl-prolyl cis-trans isomerase C